MSDIIMDPTALFRFTSGLYVVSAKAGDKVGACVINTGLQVTNDPLQVEVVVNKQNHTQQVIREAGHFALCPITQDVDMPYIGRFGFRSSADFDKFDGVKVGTTSLGDPFESEHSACVVACEVKQTLDVGTHMIFVGEVRESRPLSDVAPLTYGYYHSTLKGKTPPKASSYIPTA